MKEKGFIFTFAARWYFFQLLFASFFWIFWTLKKLELYSVAKSSIWKVWPILCAPLHGILKASWLYYFFRSTLLSWANKSAWVCASHLYCVTFKQSCSIQTNSFHLFWFCWTQLSSLTSQAAWFPGRNLFWWETDLLCFLFLQRSCHLWPQSPLLLYGNWGQKLPVLLLNDSLSCKTLSFSHWAATLLFIKHVCRSSGFRSLSFFWLSYSINNNYDYNYHDIKIKRSLTDVMMGKSSFFVRF